MIKEIFLVSFAILAITAAYPADDGVQQVGAGLAGPLKPLAEEVELFETAESAYGGYNRGYGHHGGQRGGYGHHGGYGGRRGYGHGGYHHGGGHGYHG